MRPINQFFGGTAAASVGSDVRFVTKTAKPSARESAGGFAFVPATCRIGDIVGLSKNGVPPLRLFYGGKMQNCRRRIARLVPLLVPALFLLALRERATPYEASTRRG